MQVIRTVAVDRPICSNFLIRACAFDFSFTVTRSRSGGYDERKLEQTSKPTNADGLLRKPINADGISQMNEFRDQPVGLPAYNYGVFTGI